jgi:hypothetical protein
MQREGLLDRWWPGDCNAETGDGRLPKKNALMWEDALNTCSRSIGSSINCIARDKIQPRKLVQPWQRPRLLKAFSSFPPFVAVMAFLRLHVRPSLRPYPLLKNNGLQETVDPLVAR